MEQNNSEEQKKIEVNNTETGNIPAETNAVNAAENEKMQINTVSEEKPATGNTEKLADNPSLQEAGHTAASAMSDAMPMSGISAKKIAKTFLKNIALWVFPILFATTMFLVYKFSADDGNIIAMLKTGEFYENTMLFFLPQNSSLSEEYRRRAAERYMEADKELQDEIAADVAKSVNRQAKDYSQFPVVPNIKDSNQLANMFPDDPDSQLILADNLQKGGEIKNCDATLNYLKKAAMPEKGKGNKKAQYLLANFYHHGKCTEKDEDKAMEMLKLSADQGYDAAITDYATIFIIKADEEKDENSAKNYKKAFEYLKKAAENGERFAQYKLGYLYINKPEIFESENPIIRFLSKPFNKKMQFKRGQKGEYWLRRSAEQGETSAQFILGSIHYDKYLNWIKTGEYGTDDGIEYNPAEAEKWLKKAALAGDFRAMMELGNMYYDGAFSGFAQKEIGLDYLKQAAENGHGMAEIFLAQKYLDGDLPIIQKNMEKGMALLKKVEKSENKSISHSAKILMASTYFVEKNYAEAYRYYRETNGDYSRLESIMAIYKYVKDMNLKKEIIDYVIKEAEENHYPADKGKKHLLMHRLAYLYLQGDEIIEKDTGKYEEFVKALAYDGDLSGQIHYGRIYEMRNDFENAEIWYKKAVGQDSEDAMVHLAQMHLNEPDPHYSKAIRWLKKAAAKNSKKAFNMLGLMYYLGQGVEQDYGMALSYFTRGEAYNTLVWEDKNKKEKLSALGFSKYFVQHEDNPKYIEHLEKKKAEGNNAIASLLESGAKYGTVDRAQAINYLTLAKMGKEPNAIHILEDVVSREDMGWPVYMEWIGKCARKGDSLCQAIMGDVLYEGKITAKDEEKAKEWYVRSSKKGNPQGQYKLGLMYLEAGNYDEAEKWLEKSAEQGYADAMLKLGVVYYNSYRMNKMKKALELFDAYNNKENLPLKWSAEMDFADGIRTFYNISQSLGVEKLEKAVMYGYPPAFVFLGNVYYNYGQYGKALEYFKSAANKGYCQACLALSSTYYEKLDSPEEAMEWAKKGLEIKNAQPECSGALPAIIAKISISQGKFNREYADNMTDAAEKGNEEAQMELGNLYYSLAEHIESKKTGNAGKNLDLAMEILAKGRNARYLYSQAAYWYEKSVRDTPFDKTFYKLGKIHYEGNGLKWYQKIFGRNYKAAIEWYSKAAELDYEDALLAIGMMYFDGKGVSQNYYKAMQWLRRAAHKDNKEAQFRLGYMYENALGVYKNTDEAKKWYEKAAAQGHEDAKKALEKLKN